MNKLLGLLVISLMMLSGCGTVVPDGESSVAVDFADGDDLPPVEPTEGACDKEFVFRGNVSDTYWTGKIDRGPYQFPIRYYFSPSGNVRIEEKPFEDEDWEEVQNFNVDRVMVHSDDELENIGMRGFDDDIYDVISFAKFIDKCDGLLSLDFVLLPEGSTPDAESPFTFKLTYMVDTHDLIVDALNSKVRLTK